MCLNLSLLSAGHVDKLVSLSLLITSTPTFLIPRQSSLYLLHMSPNNLCLSYLSFSLSFSASLSTSAGKASSQNGQTWSVMTGIRSDLECFILLL